MVANLGHRDADMILMPRKANAAMQDAIERYYFSRASRPKNRDAVLAQCWQALMAYYAMVEALEAASKTEQK
jgi:hypothetical protein